MSHNNITGVELGELMNAICKKHKTNMDKIASKLKISRRTLFNRFNPNKKYSPTEVLTMLQSIGVDPKVFPVLKQVSAKSCEDIIKENKHLKTINAQLVSENNSMKKIIDNFIKKRKTNNSLKKQNKEK